MSEIFEINEREGPEPKLLGGQKVNLSGLSPKLKHVLVTNGAAAELTAHACVLTACLGKWQKPTGLYLIFIHWASDQFRAHNL